MRTLFITFLLALISNSMHSQFAVSAEALIAYPLYQEKEQLGITSNRLQKGFRAGAYYLISMDGDKRSGDMVMLGVNYSHHFKSLDSAAAEVYHYYNYALLKGTVTSGFNSIIPQFGIQSTLAFNPLISCRLLIGIGVSTAKYNYEFPTYDSLSMRYNNAPWQLEDHTNTVQKVSTISPCMMINLALNYEFRYFFAYASIDLNYGIEDFTPTPFSASAGILIPFDRFFE